MDHCPVHKTIEGPPREQSIKRMQGFTLIELLLSLALFSTIVVFMFQLLLNSSSTVKLVEGTVKIQREYETLITGMVKEIQLATKDSPDLIPPSGSGLKPEDLTLMHLWSQADSNGFSRISFTASESGMYLPGRANTSGVVQIGYSLLPDPQRGGQLNLVREEMPIVSPVSKAYEQRVVFPLTKSLTFFSFRFYNKSLKQWSNVWTKSEAATNAGGNNPQGGAQGTAQTRLPDLIEIQFGFSEQSQNLTDRLNQGPIKSKRFTTLVSIRSQS
jgi:prepilin-type N-terminal cleavage/methylation domain-containing protein